MSRITLLAPLAGWSAPLSEIPDPAFAQGMLGAGVGIDPLAGELRAPCDGEVISIAAARHALALRSSAGVELLMHVGIDTVGLSGSGFEVLVRKGEKVHAGDALLRFDLDLLATRAPSLMTPVIVTNAESFRIVRTFVDRRVASGDPLIEIEAVAQTIVPAIVTPGAPVTAAAAPVVSEQVVVEHAHGIHARPAALIARCAKALPYRIEIRARGRGADARSTVALMSLGIRGGDELVIAGFEAAAA